MKQPEQMTESERRLNHLAAIECNLVYIMADVLEALWIECENLNRRCGYEMHQEEKRHCKAAIHHIHMIRGVTRQLDATDQDQFGQDADITLDLLYSAVTRTGTDNIMLCRFLEYIMSFPDKLGLDSVRQGSDAFNAIKKKLKIQ